MITLPHVHVVLSRPSEPRNIGAVCRAIKNFGITRLTVVSESAFDHDTARRLAVGADDVLDGARRVVDLRDALTGSVLVAGITRRVGQKRKQVSFSPWQLAAKVQDLAGSTVSIVFGNEQSGLSDAELELCHVAVLIPSFPEFPSLNLSHAVGVVAYELYKSALESGGRTMRRPIGYDDIVQVVDDIVGSINNLGYHTQDGPQGIRAFLREIVGRASLSTSEARRFTGLFAKIEGMHGIAHQ